MANLIDAAYGFPEHWLSKSTPEMHTEIFNAAIDVAEWHVFFQHYKFELLFQSAL